MTCIRVVYISSKHAHILHNHIYIYLYIYYIIVCDQLCMLDSFSLPIIYLQIDVYQKCDVSLFSRGGDTCPLFFKSQLKHCKTQPCVVYTSCRQCQTSNLIDQIDHVMPEACYFVFILFTHSLSSLSSVYRHQIFRSCTTSTLR